MAEREPVLVCTAWPYANGSLHVGHLAGVYVPADVFARYQRLRGRDVLMISGTDAHGTPVTVRADQEGVSPAEVAARYHAEFLTYWRDLGISYDLYTTTTTDNHREVVQEEFMMLLNKGFLYKARSTGFYDPVAQRFLPDTYIEGECPHCHYARARGNQCENCGRLLEPEDLILPHSRLNPTATLERRETEHFYLDLPKLEQPLLDWARPMHHWRPNVYRFTINFLEGGLQPRAITRDLHWGVPLPPEVGPGWDDKRIYVWFEACSGYLTAAIEWAKSSPDLSAWERFWKDPRCRQYYFIGKDNIPFHTVIWPAILLGRGDVILPYDVPANEYMNMGGQKASKSTGVGTTVPDLLRAFDPDAIRYYLIANAPETADTDYSEDDFIRRNNDELVATWGNLVHRTLSFMQRSFGGVVPEHVTDPEVAERISAARAAVEEQLDHVHLRTGLREALNLARFGNEWFDRQAPWRQVREDRAAANHAMGSLLDLINAAKVLFAPFLPHTSAALHELLGYTDSLESAGWHFEPLPGGRQLPAPKPLFRKLEVPAAEAADRSGGAPTRLILALTLVVYTALAIGYVTLTPIWQNPDEPAHYNYIAFVAQTGGLPELRPGDWDSGLLERLKNGQLQPGDSVDAIRYEGWQPPLSYLAAAPLFCLLAGDDSAAVVHELRAFSVLLGGLTLIVAYFVAREVLPAHLAAGVPLAMVGVPMFTAISASISADPLANLLAASVLLILLRRLRRDISGHEGTWAVGTGLLVGLGLLTKLSLGIFMPLALLVIVIRSARPWLEVVAMSATTGLVLLPWLVHQVTTYGWTDPLATTRHAQVVLDQQRFPGLSADYAGRILTTTFHSFWAQFGWMGVVAPDRLYWIWGAITLVALAGLFVRRRQLAAPGWRVVLLTLAAAVVGYVGYNLTYEQFQGRYLFTALVPVVILLVAGWAAWLPRWAQTSGVLMVGLALIALNAFALLRVLVPGFAPVG